MKIINESIHDEYTVYLHYPRLEVDIATGGRSSEDGSWNTRTVRTEYYLEVPESEVAEYLQDWVYDDYPETDNMTDEEYWQFILDNIDELAEKYSDKLLPWFENRALEGAQKEEQEYYDSW